MGRNLLTALIAGALIVIGPFLIRPANWGITPHRRALRPDEVQWKDVTSEAGAFCIAMPGNPAPRTGRQPARVGTISYTGLELDQTDFPALFFVFSYPLSIPREKTDLFLDGCCNEVVERMNGCSLVVHPITLGSHPGREMTFELTSGHHGLRRKDRLYLAGNRYYHLSVSTREEDAAAPFVARFLESFRPLVP